MKKPDHAGAIAGDAQTGAGRRVVDHRWMWVRMLMAVEQPSKQSALMTSSVTPSQSAQLDGNRRCAQPIRFDSRTPARHSGETGDGAGSSFVMALFKFDALTDHSGQ